MIPRLLLVAALCAGTAWRAAGQFYLHEDDNRYVGATAIDTFQAEENDPRNLGLFAPLPEPDYPDSFRFGMERFHTVISPYARFLKTSEFREEDESSALYRQILGVTAQGQDWNAMLNRAEQLLENHPDEVKNIRGLATLYAMTGKYDRAARNFARYLEKKPSDVTFLSAFAHTLFCLARFDDAQSALRRSIEINPRFLPSQYTLSCLNIATNGPSTRTRAFWRTAGIYEKEQLAGWLHTDRTPLRQVLGADGYGRLCELTMGAGSADNLLLLPDCLSEARRAFVRQLWRKALVYYELAEGYGVDGTAAKQQLARCLFETGKVPESLRRMRALTVQYPDTPEVWFNTGYLLVNAREAAEAVTAFQEACRLAPAIAEYRFAQACALAANHQMDEAFALLGPLRQKHAKDFPTWMEGDSYYLVAIRADARYAGLAAPAGDSGKK